jgi:hypothetical protein
MDALARVYHETKDPEILAEIFELARRLKRDEALILVIFGAGSLSQGSG